MVERVDYFEEDNKQEGSSVLTAPSITAVKNMPSVLEGNRCRSADYQQQVWMVLAAGLEGNRRVWRVSGACFRFLSVGELRDVFSRVLKCFSVGPDSMFPGYVRKSCGAGLQRGTSQISGLVTKGLAAVLRVMVVSGFWD